MIGKIDFIKSIGPDGVQFRKDATAEQKQLVLEFLEKSPETTDEILHYLNLKISLNEPFTHENFSDNARESIQHFFESHESELTRPSLESDYEPENLNFGEHHDPTQAGPFGFLGYGDCCQLSIRSLRSLAKYLIVLTTVSKYNRVTEGHYEYWRFTGASAHILGQIIPEENCENDESFAENASNKQSSPLSKIDPNTRPILSQDLPLLLQVALLGRRKHQAIITNHPTVEPIDTSFSNIIANNFQLATRQGFPTLEGLAGTYASRDSSSLQNKMEKWAKTTSNSETKASLYLFHDLKNTDPESVYQMVLNGSLSDQSAQNIDWGEGLIRDLHETYRVDALHGTRNYSGPAVIVSTLCCLAFWDLIGDKLLDSIKDKIESDISQPEKYKNRTLNKTWSTFDFYQWDTFLRI